MLFIEGPTYNRNYNSPRANLENIENSQYFTPRKVEPVKGQEEIQGGLPKTYFGREITAALLDKLERGLILDFFYGVICSNVEL